MRLQPQDSTAPRLGSGCSVPSWVGVTPDSLWLPSGSIPLSKAWQFPWVLIHSHWGCVSCRDISPVSSGLLMLQAGPCSPAT